MVVFDISNDRLELAKKLGADSVINTVEEEFMKKAKGLIDGKGFDYVYETAGNTITIKITFELVGNKGGVSLIGTPTKELSFGVGEWENINRKEFNLTGSWMSYSTPFPGKKWDFTAYYVATGALKFDDSFIYKKLPLSQIKEAFDMFKVPGQVKGKILIDSEK